MENIIITQIVIDAMPAEDILSHENDQYFADLYEEFVDSACKWFD